MTKSNVSLATAFAILVALAAPMLAADQSTQIYDARSAFETIKSLEGDWIGHPAGGGSPVSVRYEVTAAGSTVVKTYAPGKASEMLTIYHMDGDDLMLTHYCVLDNQPQMRFETSTAPGQISFAFAGGTNFDPEVDAHAHEGWTRVIDDSTIETESIGYSDGKPSPARRTTLKRK